MGCMSQNLLTLLQVGAVVIGVGLGFSLKAVKNTWSERDTSYVKFGGELFLNMLKGLIIPLIMSTMISAIGSLDITLSRMIGWRGLTYYMFTTFIAIALGIILTVSIQPGRFSDKGNVKMQSPDPTLVEDTLLDLIRTMFPPNLVQAALSRYRTTLVNPATPPDPSIPLDRYKMVGKWESGTNMMGLVVFSIALGIALSTIGPRGKPVLDVFKSLADATTVLTTWAIWMSPIGVVFLVASEVLQRDFMSVITSLGLYFSTVLGGLMIHGFVLLPLLYFILTRRSPFKFIGNMLPALAMAFGSSSSVATLPVTMKCLEESNYIDPRVSRFLLPIGATINMDGTALYEAAAALFIAQLVGASLSIGEIIAVAITATAASIGAAGIPQAGLVTMVMVLNTVGLPGEYISYIVPVDWLLDRFRTTVNVLGDSFGCGIVDKMCREQLEKLPFDEEKFEYVHSLSSIKETTSSAQVSSDDLANKGDDENQALQHRIALKRNVSKRDYYTTKRSSHSDLSTNLPENSTFQV
ncbi:unnamed protein product [Allacma fusca]|uniref:Amino acid transporter n=1 Tax=Allacma fusca TaxID=39272 RepID=A0A8J2KPR5_9HEXA|nr:unnamed protein product [Allacma fusca]